MTPCCRILIILSVFMLSCFTGNQRECLSAELEVLVIRPEKMPAQDTFEEGSDSLRDPFNWPEKIIEEFRADEQASQKKDILKGITLSGILWDDENPVAVINGRMMKEGDMVVNARIVKISKNEVILTTGTSRHVLHFQDEMNQLVVAPRDDNR